MTPCPKCQHPTDPAWNYCPNCGHQLKVLPLDISIGKQILIYFVSFFMSPLGVIWGFKYAKNPHRATRIVGIIAISLNLIAIGLTLMFVYQLMQTYSAILNNPAGFSYPGLR